MSYQIGDKLRITATFKDFTRVNSDPDTVWFLMKLPDGTETKYVFGTDAQIVRLAVGIFYVDFLLTQPSSLTEDYWYRWQAVGNFGCAIENSFQVDDTAFTAL